jgi:hypothetical protein
MKKCTLKVNEFEYVQYLEWGDEFILHLLDFKGIDYNYECGGIFFYDKDENCTFIADKGDYIIFLRNKQVDVVKEKVFNNLYNTI